MKNIQNKVGILSGMKGFTIIWVGQLVSLLGSGMTGFAVSIWAWQETGQATALSLAFFFAFAPQVFLSPIAGAIVDRWDRKLIMILSDVGAGITTIFLLVMFSMGKLEIWHLYVANLFGGIFGAFQFPAYSAAVTNMIPKEQYGRANGMIGLAGSASGIFAPLLAGALIGFIGIGGIMIFDVVTFVFAVLMLFLIFIPNPEETETGRAAHGNLWQESLYGFKFIAKRPSLLGLQTVFFVMNMIVMLSFSIVIPMILARTGNNELALGQVQSIGAIGGFLGGLALSLWGGPKRRVFGVLGGMLLANLLGAFPLGIGQTVFWWAIGNFAVGFFIPILNGSNQAIWQAKVPPDVQGRVFSARRVIAQIAAPIAILAAGPLADKIFEPAMSPGGSLADSFGWLVGTGPGAGIGLMFVISGVFGSLTAVIAFLFPAVRNVEDIMPDYAPIKAAPAKEETPGEPPPHEDPAAEYRTKLNQLLEVRRRLLAMPDSPKREEALKRISDHLRTLGRRSRS